jgi:predicted metal-dependent HD superfamily phosphohydrolase
MTNHRTTAETMCSNHLNERFLYEARNLYNARESEYHNWDHALDVAHMSVSILNMNRIGTEHIPTLLAAAIGHDVFHTCTTPDDERRSAEWMRKWGGINGMKHVKRSAALIDATAFHFRVLPRFHELDNHEFLMEILLDADIAGLAARYDVFLKQNEAVSKEVQNVHRFSDEELMAKRLAFVDFAIKSAEQSLLFRSPWSRRYLQPTAIENLRNYKTDIEAKGTPYP